MLTTENSKTHLRRKLGTCTGCAFPSEGECKSVLNVCFPIGTDGCPPNTFACSDNGPPPTRSPIASYPTHAPIPSEPTRAPIASDPTRAPIGTPIGTPTRAPIGTPTRAPIATPPIDSAPVVSGCQCPEINDDYIVTEGMVQSLKDAIKDNIALDGASFAGSRSDSMGELLRLVFHDVAQFQMNGSTDLSGLNGCVDLSFPGNAGLQNAVSFLEQLRDDLEIVITMADLFVLAAQAAIEAGGGPVIPYKFGRIDVPCDCETNFLPNAESEAARTSTLELDRSMVERLGLTRREVTALMGSHTLGRAEEQFSGYEGGWMPPSLRDDFNNMYYFALLRRPWVKVTKNINGAELVEWREPLESINSMFLNTDAILAFDIVGCNVFGEDPLDFINTGGADGGRADFVPDVLVPCTLRDDEYAQAVHDFADNNNLWLSEYSAAYIKMVEQTVSCGQLKDPAP